MILLLFAAWMGAERRQRIDAAFLCGAPSGEWQAELVEPLRTLRRRATPGHDDPALAAFYGAVKRLELQAEQIRIAMLCQWAEHSTPSVRAGPSFISENLRLVAGAAVGQHAAGLQVIASAAARQGA